MLCIPEEKPKKDVALAEVVAEVGAEVVAEVVVEVVAEVVALSQSVGW